MARMTFSKTFTGATLASLWIMLLAAAPVPALAQMKDMPKDMPMTQPTEKAPAKADDKAAASETKPAEKTDKMIGDPYPLATDPVTGEILGKSGDPIIYMHEGREIRFASKESQAKFVADPKTYLAKIDEAIIKLEKPSFPLKTCIVSGAKLGGDMGKPVDFVYNNRYVQFCCPDCPAKFKADPATYMSKLDAAIIDAQKANYPLTTCVVSGDKIGGDMGKPIDKVYANRLVRFCCADCPEKFAKDPLKYMKILDEAAAKEKSQPKSGSDGKSVPSMTPEKN